MRASRFLTIALPTEIGLFARCRFPAGDLLRLSLGDYITAVADTSQVYVVWTDTPNSNEPVDRLWRQSLIRFAVRRADRPSPHGEPE